MSEHNPQQTSTAERPIPPMTGDVLSFSLGREIENLKHEEEWDTHGRNSKTLVKHPDFRIVLTIMKRDMRLKEHRTAGRISVHALSGHIRIHISGQVHDLRAGQLVALDRSIPHEVEAMEDSAFLITIAWYEK